MTYEQALKASQQQATMLHSVYCTQSAERSEMISQVRRKLNAGEVLSREERDVAKAYNARAAV